MPTTRLLGEASTLTSSVRATIVGHPTYNLEHPTAREKPMRLTALQRSAFGRMALVIAVLALVATLPCSAQSQQALATASALSPELEQARTALDKYRDPVVAVHDGYFSTVGCVEYPKGGTEGSMKYAPGGMGVHFLNMQLVGPTLDPTKPQVLIYEPVGDRLRLVAAEWFVPVQAAGPARPTVFGKELEGPMEGHTPLMPEGLHHYDLHVWLWKDNPAGLFSATNSAVRCPKGAYSFAENAPKLVAHPGH
jgi:hypothetical protein